MDIVKIRIAQMGASNQYMIDATTLPKNLSADETNKIYSVLTTKYGRDMLIWELPETGTPIPPVGMERAFLNPSFRPSELEWETVEIV